MGMPFLNGKQITSRSFCLDVNFNKDIPEPKKVSRPELSENSPIMRPVGGLAIGEDEDTRLTLTRSSIERLEPRLA